ncbi:MAG: hypothetical protein JHC92_10390, partial [Sphingomonadaceae bacterium]|nr:hypothetical protein [Sphingomonadaceae bacterium]
MIFPAITLMLTGGVILNAPSDPDYVETAWIVQPDASQLGVRKVSDSAYVLKNRLLPPSLIQLQDDVKDEKSGKILAKSGDQLFGLLSRGAPVFCVNAVPKPDIVVSLLVRGVNLQRCLIDNDADGRLDSHFNAGSAVPGLPNFYRKRPKKAKAVSGGSYRHIDPALDNQNYFVGVRYEGTVGKLSKQPSPTFSVRFGTEENTGMMSDNTMSADKSFPFMV